MGKTDPNSSAYPVAGGKIFGLNDPSGEFPPGSGFADIKAQPGLTKREAFAMAAMPCAWHAYDSGYFDAKDFDSANSVVAQCAVQMADALIAALNNDNKGEK